MSVGRVAFNDPVANFFKAVETARQRNVTAFERIQPVEKFEMPASASLPKSTSAISLEQQSKPIITGVNAAPAASTHSHQPIRTKILGNFFDAYA